MLLVFIEKNVTEQDGRDAVQIALNNASQCVWKRFALGPSEEEIYMLILRKDYDEDHDPPAPTIRITIKNPYTLKQAEPISGIIDTGSFITCVPPQILKHLGLRPMGTVSERDPTPTYQAYIDAPPLYSDRLEVAPSPSDEFALLGRDILNRFKFTFVDKAYFTVETCEYSTNE